MPHFLSIAFGMIKVLIYYLNAYMKMEALKIDGDFSIQPSCALSKTRSSSNYVKNANLGHFGAVHLLTVY